MLTIHKFQLEITFHQIIEVREGAKILHADNQNGMLCIWVMLDTNAPTVQKRFRIYGTGHSIPTDLNLTHIGSVLMGAFVWHVFEDSFI